MQSTFDNFAAEEPGENPHAGKKDSKAEVIQLNDARKDLRIVFDLRRVDVISIEDIVNEEQQYRDESQQVNPNPAAAEQIAARLIAHEDGNLARVEPPRLLFRPFLRLRDHVLSAHAGPPSDPMRYW